jgi:hypothetical protein
MRRLAFFALGAALAGGAAIAQVAATPDAVRTLQFELREGNRLIGTPSVTLQPGRSAAVSVGGLYSLRMRFEQQNDSDGGYLVRSTLYRTDGSGSLIASPSISVAEGQQARARFADSNGATMTLAVLVR